MSRPSRADRAAQKGRPKRRAAATHLFKYQLAKNPSKAEEEALKRALQESLEEQNVPMPRSISTSNKTTIRKINRVINSSTNSSDVSKTSTNSTSTSNISLQSANGVTKKRLKLDTACPNSRLSASKRAKPTTNGHKSNSTFNNNKVDCDKNLSVLSGSPPPILNRAIRTYSRSQTVNGRHDLEQQKDSLDIAPRSSTPISKKQASLDEKLCSGDVKSADGDVQESVSKSTQTSAPSISKICNIQNDTCDKNGKKPKSTNGPHSVEKLATSLCESTNGTVSAEDQQPKLKRESKNYAYAKMTALKVNTYASPYTYLKPTHVKKTSPTGILNNHANKNTVKTLSRVKKSGLGLFGANSTSGLTKSGKKSPTSNAALEHKQLNSTKSPAKGTFKHISSKCHLKNDQLSNTIDLSKINPTGLSVTKKCVAPGSWSLLGVPEEKIMYLRDDEPPRRLICYPAIKHVEGDVIQVRDSVLLRSETNDLPYIAKVYAFWEDADTGGVMMSLYWYYRPEHIEEGRKPHHLPDEIFASRHRDIDSVECIEDRCYVLTFNEYCRYRKRVKMEQVGTTWSLSDVTIPVTNESYPRRNRIPDMNVNPELIFCCRQIYDSRMKRLIKNPLINPKYGHI